MIEALLVIIAVCQVIQVYNASRKQRLAKLVELNGFRTIK